MEAKSVEQRLEELEKKARVAEDTEQIKQLHIRFKNAHVAGDHTGEAECFSENGILEIHDHGNVLRHEGKAAIGTFGMGEKAEEIKIPQSPFTEGGFVVHPQITVDGDKAAGKWVNYNLFAITVTTQSVFWMQATEDAEYVRENGEWKISFMRWELLFGIPAQGG